MHRDYNKKQVMFPLFYSTPFSDSYFTTVHFYMYFITEALSGVCNNCNKTLETTNDSRNI